MSDTKGMTEYKCPICRGIWLSETTPVSRKEIREARDNWGEVMWPVMKYFSCFLGYRDYCEESQDEALCRLCKRLTQFAQ